MLICSNRRWVNWCEGYILQTNGVFPSSGTQMLVGYGAFSRSSTVRALQTSRRPITWLSQAQPKRVHEVTWRSPDGATENQIDHFLIEERHFSSLLDVQRWGADSAQSLLSELFGKPGIVAVAKSRRLSWAVHVVRDETRCPRIVLNAQSYVEPRTDGPRSQWIDDLAADLRRCKVMGWKSKANDRTIWNCICEEDHDPPKVPLM